MSIYLWKTKKGKVLICKKWMLIIVFSSVFFSLKAQYTMGTTGLLNTPSADMQQDGTFMAGGNYLPDKLTPDYWDYNTGNYFINLTFLPFLELGYRCTLLKVDQPDGTKKWNQDRSVMLRLQALRESRYLPSIVIGSNDLFTTNDLNPFKQEGGNRFFSSMYAVGTKHLLFGGEDIGITFGGYIPFYKGLEYKGAFGGISYRPSFLKPVSVIAE